MDPYEQPHAFHGSLLPPVVNSETTRPQPFGANTISNREAIVNNVYPEASFQRLAPQDNWNDPPPMLARTNPTLSGSARQLNTNTGSILQTTPTHYTTLFHTTGSATASQLHHSSSYPNLAPADSADGALMLNSGVPFTPNTTMPALFTTTPDRSSAYSSGETTLHKIRASIANSFRPSPKINPATNESFFGGVLDASQQQTGISAEVATQVATLKEQPQDVPVNDLHSSTTSAVDSLNALQAIWYYQTLQSAVDEIKPAWVPFIPPENRKLEAGYQQWVEVCKQQHRALAHSKRGLTSTADSITDSDVPRSFVGDSTSMQKSAFQGSAASSGFATLNADFFTEATDGVTGEDIVKTKNILPDHPANESHLCAVFGGRHDVDFEQMQLLCVFWDEPPRLVLRATWFYKGATETSFQPYDQAVCLRFEEDYQRAWRLGTWHNRIDIGNGEALVIHSPNAISHFVQPEQSTVWVTVPDALLRPRAVRRSAEGVHIDYPSSAAAAAGVPPFPPPPTTTSHATAAPGGAAAASTAAQYYDSSYDVDHLVFVVHGIGSVCDLKMRNVIECVGNLRQISRGLLLEHWREYLEQNQIHRVEFLPIEWHSKLHGKTTGVDERLKTITLPSIPKLRNFTNETLLDILFYTSPTYCQTIAETVACEINRLTALYRRRNPRFCGKVSIIGHSLGSLIVFDLLANQQQTQQQSDAVDLSSINNNNNNNNNSDQQPLHAPVDRTGRTAHAHHALSVPDIRVPTAANNDPSDKNTTNKSSSNVTLEDLIHRAGVVPDDDSIMTVKQYADKLRTEAGAVTVDDLMLLTEADFDRLNIPLVQRRRLLLAAGTLLPGGRIAQLRRQWLQQHGEGQTARNNNNRRSSSLAVRGSSLLRVNSSSNNNNNNKSNKSPATLETADLLRNNSGSPAWKLSDASLYSFDSNVAGNDRHGTSQVASSLSEPNLSTLLTQMSTLAVNYTVSTDANGGVGQPSVFYPKLDFNPECFFAVGSPISMFLTVRGVKNIGIDYKLPTCARFLNIFHPYDVVAYRIEPLIRPDLSDSLPSPVQLPHHKGRKRYHRQLQDHVGTVTAGIKNPRQFVDNIWSTLTSWPFGGGTSAVSGATTKTADNKNQSATTTNDRNDRAPPLGEALLHAAINAATGPRCVVPVVADPGTAQSTASSTRTTPFMSPVHTAPGMLHRPDQQQNEVKTTLPPPTATDLSSGFTLGGPASALAASFGATLTPNDSIVVNDNGQQHTGGFLDAVKRATTESAAGRGTSTSSSVFDMGQLNGGQRVDHVLQESALESVNQYLFAFHAHTCYWDSEDTIFMILLELYGKDGFAPLQFSHETAGGKFHNYLASSQHRHPNVAMPSASTFGGVSSPVLPPPFQQPVSMPPMFSSAAAVGIPQPSHMAGSSAAGNNNAVASGLSSSPFFGMPPLHGSMQYPLLPGAAYVAGSIMNNNNSNQLSYANAPPVRPPSLAAQSGPPLPPRTAPPGLFIPSPNLAFTSPTPSMQSILPPPLASSKSVPPWQSNLQPITTANVQPNNLSAGVILLPQQSSSSISALDALMHPGLPPSAM